MFKVYGDVYSGNCYKLKLLLTQLQQPFEWIFVDILKQETRTPEFLAKNPNGKMPVLKIEEGVYLTESNAILCYLAADSKFFPKQRLAQARVLEWLFFEQYSHEPYIATSRYIIRYLGAPESHRQILEEKREPGYRALQIMETHLSQHSFLVDERYTIADIGLYAYTHVAHEGGFDLARFPAVQAWLQRVNEQPDHVTMDG